MDKSEEDLLRECREMQLRMQKIIQYSEKKMLVESQRGITQLEVETSELKSQFQEGRKEVETEFKNKR